MARRWTPPPTPPEFDPFNEAQKKAGLPWQIYVDGDVVCLDDLRRESDNLTVFVCKCTWPPGAVLECNAWIEGYEDRPRLEAHLKKWGRILVEG